MPVGWCCCGLEEGTSKTQEPENQQFVAQVHCLLHCLLHFLALQGFFFEVVWSAGYSVQPSADQGQMQ